MSWTVEVQRSAEKELRTHCARCTTIHSRTESRSSRRQTVTESELATTGFFLEPIAPRALSESEQSDIAKMFIDDPANLNRQIDLCRRRAIDS